MDLFFFSLDVIWERYAERIGVKKQNQAEGEMTPKKKNKPIEVENEKWAHGLYDFYERRGKR